MIIISLIIGLAAGMLYFHGLWWNTCLFASGGRTRVMIMVMVGRFVLLGGLLTLASLQGAMPLMAMALGVFGARFIVMRRLSAV